MNHLKFFLILSILPAYLKAQCDYEYDPNATRTIGTVSSP